MMEKFNALSSREKILIAVMLGLFCVIIIWQFLWSPVFKGHAQAQNNQIKAQNDLAYVQRHVGQLGAESATKGTLAFSRNVIFELSRKAGVENLSRVQPQPNGDLKIWVDNISAPSLFQMLSEIEQNYTTRITAAQISRRAGGTVSAQISFSMPKRLGQNGNLQGGN